MSLNENDELKCNFCGKSFKYKSSLKKHIQTAKFCLNIQNKAEPEIEKKKFICEYCNCEFKCKQNLQSHLLVCKEKDKLKLREEYNKKLEDLKNEYLDIINNQKIIIAELNGKIQIYERDHNVISDIAKQTKITNTNNIINNMAVYDIDSIKDRLINSNITKMHIMNGQSGIAEVIAPYLTDESGNKMIACTDIPRLSFSKIDDNKNRIKDHELKNLATDIKPIALQKSR